MERIRIKNFGPLNDIDLSIPRLLLFIGDQATGKSTLSKLIYTFRNLTLSLLPRPFFHNFDESVNDLPSMTMEESLNIVKNHILSSFDPCYFSTDTIIEFFYTEKYSIKISNVSHSFIINFSEALSRHIERIESLRNKIPSQLKSKVLFSDNNYFAYQKEIFNLYRQLRVTAPTEYVGAHRASTNVPALGAYTSELGLEFSQKLLRGCFRLLNSEADLVQITKIVEDYYSNNKLVLSRSKTNSETHYENTAQQFVAYFGIIRKLSQRILGGDLVENKEGDFTLALPAKKTAIPYSCLSSGQKSVIPIITTIFLMSTRNIQSLGIPIPFRSAIIEEPEAHLFPENQFALVKILAAALKMNKNASFVITTHTPYILSSIHALMAYGKAPHRTSILKDYDDLVPLSSDKEDVEIYLLRNGQAFSLRNLETQMFNTEEIDKVSESINEVFDASVIDAEYSVAEK